eukprot:m.190661 g.190661  ORF g.190661 m.190661 type:complete len:71 (+) comp39435_c0_seq13:2911-3123(+)
MLYGTNIYSVQGTYILFTFFDTCVLLGAMSGPLWASDSQNIYLTTCSVRVAWLTGSTEEAVIQRLTGTFL